MSKDFLKSILLLLTVKLFPHSFSRTFTVELSTSSIPYSNVNKKVPSFLLRAIIRKTMIFFSYKSYRGQRESH